MEKKMFDEHTQEVKDLINSWIEFAPIYKKWFDKLFEKPFSIRPYNKGNNESDKEFDKRVNSELNNGYNMLITTHAPRYNYDVAGVHIFNKDFTDNTLMYEDLNRDNHMIYESVEKNDWGYYFEPYGYVIETDKETLNKLDRRSRNRVRV